jgi:hypothetical protein
VVQLPNLRADVDQPNETNVIWPRVECRQALDGIAAANQAQGDAIDAVITATEKALRLFASTERHWGVAVARRPLPPDVLEYFRREGSRGATLQAANMTPAQRKARATKASRAAALARTKKKHTKQAKAKWISTRRPSSTGRKLKAGCPGTSLTISNASERALPTPQRTTTAQ